jgi:photosystem II stability/assembly factor-like uncharacterized protein
MVVADSGFEGVLHMLATMSTTTRKHLALGLLLCMILLSVECSMASDGAVEQSQRSQASTVTPPRKALREQETIRFIPHPAEPPSLTPEGTLIDAQNAWVKDEGQLLKTTDSGKTWQTFSLSPTHEAVFGRLSEMTSSGEFITASRGWLDTVSGTWQTEDGGATWHRIFSDRAIGPVFINEKLGWLGLASEDGQQSYVTDDQGETWEPCGPKVEREKHTPYDKPYFLSRQLGWTITSQTKDGSTIYGVAKTVDGGCHWKQMWTNVEEKADEQDERYGDIFFVSENEGWLAGTYIGSLKHTTDGGRVWQRVPLPQKDFKIVSVYFENPTSGWIVGGYPSMLEEDTGEYHTSDGGKLWRQLKQGDIVKGFDENGRHIEIPEKWKAGKLLQLLYVSRVKNING